jgi:hypothetical protein
MVLRRSSSDFDHGAAGARLDAHARRWMTRPLRERVALAQMRLEQPCDRPQDLIDFLGRARRSLRGIAFARAGSDGETAERDADPAEQEKFEPRNFGREAQSQRNQRERSQKHCAERKGGAKMRAKQQQRIHEMTVPRARMIAESIVALEDREDADRVAEREPHIASRIAADLRSAPRTPFMASATARTAKSHARTESVQVIRTIPF